MTNVAKINSVAAASVGKHLGVASANIAKVGGADFPGGFAYPYPVDNSCLFSIADSTYMDYTPSAAGDMRTNTFSCWWKTNRYNLTGTNLNALCGIQIAAGAAGYYIYSNTLTPSFYLTEYVYSGPYMSKIMHGKARDFSAWQNVVVQCDTTQATAYDRFTIWYNGVEITDWGTDINTTAQNEQMMMLNPYPHTIGRQHQYNRFTDMMFAQHCCCDGQAYTADDFGEFVGDVWVPKDITGLTFGSKGWFLDFADPADLGKDVSGNGNHWDDHSTLTSANQSTDTPTNNFATMNPLQTDNTLSKGNLNIDPNAGSQQVTYSGFAPLLSGKWYWEIEIANHQQYTYHGVCYDNGDLLAGIPASSDLFYTQWNPTVMYVYYTQAGSNYSPSVTMAAGDTYTIMVAVDIDAGKAWMGKDGVWLEDISSNVGDPGAGVYPCATFTDIGGGAIPFSLHHNNGGATNILYNFGGTDIVSATPTYADDNGYGNFEYAPPTGFMALCSANLQDSAGTDPAVGEFAGNEGFYTEIFTHNGTSHEITLPWDTDTDDTMVMVKNISVSESWWMADTVRGDGKTIPIDDGLTAESDSANSISFSGTTVTLGSDFSANDYVIYAFRAGVEYGFDIQLYTGNSAGRTIAHALGAVPEMMWCFKRSLGSNRAVYHKDLTSADYYLLINEANAQASASNRWNGADPTSSVFSVGTGNDTNATGETFVIYLFASIEGFSYFGSYEGNANADGSFINCGFKPALWISKDVDTAAIPWYTTSISMDGVNGASYYLVLDDTTTLTGPVGHMDIVSNGVKQRGGGSWYNGSSKTFICMAWAAQPFKYANAR